MGAHTPSKIALLRSEIDEHHNGKVTWDSVVRALRAYGFPVDDTEVSEVMGILRPGPEPSAEVRADGATPDQVGRRYLEKAEGAGLPQDALADATIGLLAVVTAMAARDEAKYATLDREFVEKQEALLLSYEDHIQRLNDLIQGWEQWDEAHEVSIGAILHDLRWAETGRPDKGAEGVSG